LVEQHTRGLIFLESKSLFWLRGVFNFGHSGSHDATFQETQGTMDFLRIFEN